MCVFCKAERMFSQVKKGKWNIWVDMNILSFPTKYNAYVCVFVYTYDLLFKKP